MAKAPLSGPSGRGDGRCGTGIASRHGSLIKDAEALTSHRETAATRAALALDLGRNARCNR